MRPTSPRIRRAPIDEFKIYEIIEGELNELARGSPESILLNYALALLPVAVTIFTTLVTTPIASLRAFVVFVVVVVVSFVVGLLCLLAWWRDHRTSWTLIETIRNRMPPPLGIQDAPGTPGGVP
jgi:hypothetical protein